MQVAASPCSLILHTIRPSPRSVPLLRLQFCATIHAGSIVQVAVDDAIKLGSPTLTLTQGAVYVFDGTDGLTVKGARHLTIIGDNVTLMFTVHPGDGTKGGAPPRANGLRSVHACPTLMPHALPLGPRVGSVAGCPPLTTDFLTWQERGHPLSKRSRSLRVSDACIIDSLVGVAVCD